MQPSLASGPAACRYLVSAEETSARPPVFDSGAASDAMRQTVRVIMRLPVYDVGQSAPRGGAEVTFGQRTRGAGFAAAPLSDRTGRGVAAHCVDRSRRYC